MDRPIIPKYTGPHPSLNGHPVKQYIHWDKETSMSFVTDVVEDGTERFSHWLPPSFWQCLEQRINAGKFGKVETYRL